MAALIAGFSGVVRGRVGDAVQGGVLVTRRWWVASLGLVVGVVILSALASGIHVRRDWPDRFRGALSGGVPRPGLSSLPAAAQPAVSETLGAADRAYWALGSSGTLEAVSDAQGFRVRFSPAGVSVGLGSSLLTLRLVAVGVSDRLRALPAVVPRERRNRVWYARGVVSEWYVNGPLGLEQGFTIAHRLGGRHGGPSTFSLSVGGNLHPVLAPGGRSLSFKADGGWSALSYRGLVASDARGRSLGAWLSLNGRTIEIHVDDRGARYPLRIDPLIQQGSKLVGTGFLGYAGQGSSVALSADGSTALVGGPHDNNELGAAWVFIRSGSTWAQQGPKLVGAGAIGPQVNQGASVALSANGSIALIGGPGDRNHGPNGAAWVFTRSGSTWTQQGPKLVGTGVVGYSEQGAGVALSADGTTALIGGFTDDSYKGAVWVFARSGSTWAQQGPKLVGAGAVGASQQGSSVALSADGSTALIGGDGDDSSQGAAWVFARSGTTWVQQGPKLVGAGAVGGYIAQGASVALSADGDTALVGGFHDNGGTGAAWVFARSGSTWTQQGPKLVGSGAVAIPVVRGSLGAEQGMSVALSADGSTALIGGPSDNGWLGATWVFSRSGSTWIQQGPKIVGTAVTGRVRQGTSVALSADGSTALIGGPTGRRNNVPRGAAWVFTRSGSSWRQQGPKLVGTGATGRGEQGASVALSADGNTALIGGFADEAGAAWVFTRSGATWTQQGRKLVGTGATGNAWQGSSVALSADGNTALIGGPRDKGLRGAAWVFTRSGSTWTQQGRKLVGAGATRYASEGSSVALSADGRTALIGGPGHRGGAGAVWVFTRSGSTWTQRARLVGAGASGRARQGSSVALAARGDTAIIGGPEDHGGAGAVWVFIRSGATWTQRGGKLVGTGGIGHAGQGSSVALSADGSTALSGGPNDNHARGAVWVFIRSGATWTQRGGKLVGTGAIGHAGQGSSVALSADGSTALSGGPNDNHARGAAWVFTRSGLSWTQQGTKLVGTGAVVAGSLGAGQGTSVALSANAATALTGGPYYSDGEGATWVWASQPTPQAAEQPCRRATHYVVWSSSQVVGSLVAGERARRWPLAAARADGQAVRALGHEDGRAVPSSLDGRIDHWPGLPIQRRNGRDPHAPDAPDEGPNTHEAGIPQHATDRLVLHPCRHGHLGAGAVSRAMRGGCRTNRSETRCINWSVG